MTTEKPTKIIALLNAMANLNDKKEIMNIYNQVASEVLTVKFLDFPNQHFSGLMFKHLIRLSMKDYIHQNQSPESKQTLIEVADMLNSVEIAV